MPKLVIVRGLPGSGKTTHAKSLVDENNKPFFHVEADMYFVNEAGKYRFYPKLIGVAHDWCQHEAAKALERGENVVVSNTFVKRWELEPYIKMAKTLGAELEVVEMKNNWGNIHSVPPEVLSRMAAQWETFCV